MTDSQDTAVLRSGPVQLTKVRRARFRLTRIDPWTVMKTSALFAFAMAIIAWVSVYVLWTVVGASGMIERINQVLKDVLSTPSEKNPVRVGDFINTYKLMGVTTIVVFVNVILSTALATLFAFLYNLSANILGGLEVTLSED